MSDGNNKEKKLKKRYTGFLTGKPIWAWWIFYLASTAALFGIFRLAFYLLGIKPWIGVLILAATGLIWGTVMYSRNKKENKNLDEENIA
jgi:hypothetical protein